MRVYHTAPVGNEHIPIHGSVCIYDSWENTSQGVKAEVGTTGTLVWDSGGNPFILTNKHVLFPDQFVKLNTTRKIGDAVYQCADKTQSKSFGTIFKTVSEKNPWPIKSTDDTVFDQVGDFHDSSLIKSNVGVSDDINGIGKITGVTEPVIGMKIKVNGFTSGMQSGKITKINENVAFPLPKDSTKAVVCKNIFRCDAKTAQGDSGSAILTTDNKIVGLLFAGNQAGTETIACKASAIAKAYGITFVRPANAKDTVPTPTPAPSGGGSSSIGDISVPDFVREKGFIIGVALIFGGLIIMSIGQR